MFWSRQDLDHWLTVTINANLSTIAPGPSLSASLKTPGGCGLPAPALHTCTHVEGWSLGLKGVTWALAFEPQVTHL